VQAFLLDEVRRRGLAWLLAGDERAQQLVARVRFLASLDAAWSLSVPMPPWAVPSR